MCGQRLAHRSILFRRRLFWTFSLGRFLTECQLARRVGWIGGIIATTSIEWFSAATGIQTASNTQKQIFNPTLIAKLEGNTDFIMNENCYIWGFSSYTYTRFHPINLKVVFNLVIIHTYIVRSALIVAIKYKLGYFLCSFWNIISKHGYKTTWFYNKDFVIQLCYINYAT